MRQMLVGVLVGKGAPGLWGLDGGYKVSPHQPLGNLDGKGVAPSTSLESGHGRPFRYGQRNGHPVLTETRQNPLRRSPVPNGRNIPPRGGERHIYLRSLHQGQGERLGGRPLQL